MMNTIYNKVRPLVFLLTLFFVSSPIARAQQGLDAMWGEHTAVKQVSTTHLFDWGNYAMFIHWGLYSQVGNLWKGKTYYGASEWIMNKLMADIPIDEYKAIAGQFNPTAFDADKIVKLAKDAGMKYIIITAKHHDGFAMYNSKACDFNIVKQTPFGRDPMKELSDACRRQGIGFGFYYSHNKDWTYPGGNGGPQTDVNGVKKTFDDYFNEKCLPQVEELTKNYGDIQLIWFDTPGGMPEKYAKKLVEVVHRNQPHALVSGRVGYDMGDYRTLGDMEQPLENINGRWESIDVTNDSWGYAWYDQNWKTPRQILSSLISVVARGGTYMLNVGPDGSGSVPQPAQEALLAAGKWLKAYPEVVYGAGASPWKHALPWGDITINNGKLYLSVYTWPSQGKLFLPGFCGTVKDVKLFTPRGKQSLKYNIANHWLEVELPMSAPDKLVSVIELTPASLSEVADSTLAVDPDLGIQASVKFGEVAGGKVTTKRWMEKFGEWKTDYILQGWNNQTVASWLVDIKQPGMYQVALRYAADKRLVWKVETDEGVAVQNQQGGTSSFLTYPIGWIKVNTSGKHRFSVKLVSEDAHSVQLSTLIINPI
jgi:alpha-L-fucosidase